MGRPKQYKEFKKIALAPYYWIVTRDDQRIAYISRGSNNNHYVFDINYREVMNSLPSMQSAYNSLLRSL
jgi:hypothetical protein